MAKPVFAYMSIGWGLPGSTVPVFNGPYRTSEEAIFAAKDIAAQPNIIVVEMRVAELVQGLFGDAADIATPQAAK